MFLRIITLFNFCVEEFASHLHPFTVHVVLTLILNLLFASIEFVDYILFPSLFHMYIARTWQVIEAKMLECL